MFELESINYHRLLSGKQALLVNCEAETQEAIARLFREHGAQVRIANTLEELAQKYPGDILICGMRRPEGQLFHLQQPGAVSRNVFADLQLAESAVHCVLEHMMNRCQGTIVAMVSEYGDYNVPMRSIEGATAQALGGLIRALAMDYSKYNIRANCVLTPFQLGAVGTAQLEQQNITAEKARDLQLIRRLPQPEDVANAALFLASDMSGFISGETIPVNGGGFNIGHNQVWENCLNNWI